MKKLFEWSDGSRAGASTTRVLILPQMINMNVLKTLYSSTTRVLIFQYLYSYVQYSPQPWMEDKPVFHKFVFSVKCDVAAMV